MILAMDTSSSYLTLAIYDTETGCILDDINMYAPREHATLLVPLLSKVLQKNHLKIDDFKAIVVGLGPGSYTGIRIGYMVAKTLSFTHKLPLYGFSTLAMLANEANFFSGTIFPLLAARKGYLYTAAYRFEHDEFYEITPPCLVAETEKFFASEGKVLLIGLSPMEEFFANLCDRDRMMYMVRHPRAANLAYLAAKKLTCLPSIDDCSAPFYLSSPISRTL